MALSSSVAFENDDVCWICLSAENDKCESLSRPCKCPSFVHKNCLAKWQVNNIGKDAETTCRFCMKQLPDWKSVIVPPKTNIVRISLHINNRQVDINIDPSKTPDLKAELIRIIKEDFNVDCEDALSITYFSKLDGHTVKSKGLENADAALHLAKINAASRLIESNQ